MSYDDMPQKQARIEALREEKGRLQKVRQTIARCYHNFHVLGLTQDITIADLTFLFHTTLFIPFFFSPFFIIQVPHKFVI